MSRFTSHLFARPSFLEGCARALDLGCTLDRYNTQDSPDAADAVALWADWCAVGEDIAGAVSTFETERAQLAEDTSGEAK